MPDGNATLCRIPYEYATCENSHLQKKTNRGVFDVLAKFSAEEAGGDIGFNFSFDHDHLGVVGRWSQPTTRD